MCRYHIIPVVPARGGAEVACKSFLTYRTCMRRAPARPLRALWEPVALLLSKNMTCVRHFATQRQANTFFTLQTALFTPRTHFALHLISFLLTSSQLFSSHPISSQMSSK